MGEKPLNRKSYGSICHIPGSRTGPADRLINPGQDRIATKVHRKGDVIIVQEKLDGTNVGVCLLDGEIIPLIRAGYRADESQREQHKLFARWVNLYENTERFRSILNEGDRICGEWLVQACGTRYDLKHEPFVAFDYFRDDKRLPYREFEALANKAQLVLPTLLHEGGVFTVEQALEALHPFGGHGALEEVEGAVWRIETKGVVNFLTKFVRHSKVDGKYFPENYGVEVWNVDLKEFYKSLQ